MKYKIDIMSQDECIDFSNKNLNDECIIISINDTGYDTNISKNDKIIDVCKLWFDDIERNTNQKLKLMTIDQAKGIKEFVDKYKNKIDNLVIHCTAGISRSSSIGCVIARYLNNDDNYLWATGRYMPNKHVYKTMCEAFNLKYSDDLFKYKLKLRYKSDRVLLKNYDDCGISIEDFFI